MNYNLFIEKYKSKIKMIPTFEEYEEIYSIIKEYCKNVIINSKYPLNYLNGTTEFVCAYMLSISTPTELKIYNNKNKIEAVAKKLLLSIPHNKIEKNDAKEYIKELLIPFKPIFEENENLDTISQNIYNDLNLNGIKDGDIILQKNDNEIYSSLIDGYGYCKFTEDFITFKDYIRSQVSSCFARNKLEIIRKDQSEAYKNPNFKYYDNQNFCKLIGTKMALGLYGNGYRNDNVNILNINKIAEEYLYYEATKTNSIKKEQLREEQKVERYYPTHVREKRKNKEELRKKAIVIALIFGAIAAENIIYNVSHNHKEPKPEKPKYSASQINPEYVPGSYWTGIEKYIDSKGRFK